MELIYKKDALRAVLHNEGQAAVAAVENIKPVDMVDDYPIRDGKYADNEFDSSTFYCSDGERKDLHELARTYTRAS